MPFFTAGFCFDVGAAGLHVNGNVTSHKGPVESPPQPLVPYIYIYIGVLGV